MSYQALARKWRPQNFTEVVGQEHVVSALANALTTQKVHHAYLFTGTRGVGKTTLARIFARALNCESGMSATPCGECIACVGVSQGNYIDLIEVDAASRTRVDDTRELLDNVQYAPTQGRYKIYLIDEVHMLSGHSFNALLKTLEEPPPHVKFLLATTDPQKLPATILSRCIQFNLKAMDLDRLTGQLEKILTAEQVPFDPPALQVLGRSADGSVRDALSLLDQAIAFGNGEVRLEQVRAMLGMIDNDYTRKLLLAVCANDPAAVLQTIGALAERVVDYGAALDDLLTTVHHVALYHVDAEAVGAKGIDKGEIERLAAECDPELTQLLYQIGVLGKRDLELAPDPRTGFEMTLLRMTSFQPQSSETGAAPSGQVESLARGGDQSRSRRIQRATPEPVLEPTASAAKPVELEPASPHRDCTLAEAEAAETMVAPALQPNVAPMPELADHDRWLAFVERGGINGIGRELAMNMIPGELQGETMQMTLDAESRHLYSDARLEKIQQAFADFHGASTIKLAVEISEIVEGDPETPSRQKQRITEQSQKTAERNFEQDPNVQDLINRFDAEIVADSVRPPSD